jgi:hypothetical protein
LPQLQPLFLQIVCERESASVSGTVGNQSLLGVFKTPTILVLLLIEAAECVLQP